MSEPPIHPADRPALRLPVRYLITGADPCQPGPFLDHLRRALDSGLRLVQLRAPSLPERGFISLVEACMGLCRERGARLLVNAAPELARRVGADGVHLNSRCLMALERRPGGLLVAASCHTAGELARASALGLDFAVLSPVLPTPSHPGAEPLGWERFSQMLVLVPLPVYALGGMNEGLIGEARARGAQGVAGISGFWPES